MVAECDEQVEKELTATVEHLKLHGTATLEGGPTTDDESEIVGAQLGVGIGCVRVSIAGRGENSAALNAGLCC